MLIFRLLAFPILLVGSGTVSAFGQAPTEPPAPASVTLQQVQDHLAAGRSDEALALLDRLQPNDSDRPLLEHLRGLGLYQKGQYQEAIEHLQQARNAPSAAPAQKLQGAQLLGLSHYFLGHSEQAIPFLEEFSRAGKDTLETNYALGLCYIQAHKSDDARRAFAQMFSVPADSASAHLLNAQMMIRQQFEEFADKELRTALRLDPELPQVNFLLGELAIYKADIDGGIALLKREIQVNPGFAMAYYRLGDAYSRQSKWAEAIGPLQQSIWLNPFFSGPFIVLGKVYLKTGNLTNAESILKRGLAMDVNNYSGHHLLAQVLQKAGRAEEARQEFQTAERLRSAGAGER